MDKIYKITATGKVQEWEIEVAGNSYRTITGQQDGKKITNEWTVCEGKNIGKSNETTPEQQAVLEAAALRRKKLEKDYVESLETTTTYASPMLAQTYEKGKTKLTFPVYTQPKLDGVRCVCFQDEFKSRNGKMFRPNIISSPFEYTIDGELYLHGETFNTIVSEVKKPRGIPIKYYVYDVIIQGMPFSERTKILSSLKLPADWVLVPTFTANNQEELDKLYVDCMEQGYEGMMIRLDGPYEHKRSKNLLKMKTFQDAEFEILDIVEGTGNRTGTAGYIETKNEAGKSFRSNIKGDFTYLADLLANKQDFIGKKATIKFFEYTPDGIPRFPYVIGIGREDYE
jgi:DNA ligase-1